MTLQRAALWAIVIAATMYLLVAARGLLLPFVLGLALWYMVDAMADSFERPRLGNFKLPRLLAVLLAFCVMGGLAWIIGRTITRNITAVAAAAPNYEVRLEHLLTQGARLIGVEQTPTLTQLFDHISLTETLSGVAAAAASIVSVTGIVLIGLLAAARIGAQSAGPSGAEYLQPLNAGLAWCAGFLGGRALAIGSRIRRAPHFELRQF